MDEWLENSGFSALSMALCDLYRKPIENLSTPIAHLSKSIEHLSTPKENLSKPKENLSTPKKENLSKPKENLSTPREILQTPMVVCSDNKLRCIKAATSFVAVGGSTWKLFHHIDILGPWRCTLYRLFSNHEVIWSHVMFLSWQH